MREQLIGYLLNALEPGEREAVEHALEHDTELREELSVLARGLTPLRCARDEAVPPAGLATRTCQFVAEQIAVRPAPVVPVSHSAPARWNMADVVVAAAVLFTLSLLFVPALGQSRFMARLVTCQDKLRTLGSALTVFSERHDGYLPKVAPEGRFGVAGVYAVSLHDNGLLDDHSVLVCPGSELAVAAKEFRVPTSEQIRLASAVKLKQLHLAMGGDYASWLGFVSDGRYRAVKHHGRARSAVLADRPTIRPEIQPVSLHHGGRGQNVLFDDGHVEFMVDCCVRGCGDNVYFNNLGQIEAGTAEDDAVLAASGTPALSILVPGNSADFLDLDRHFQPK